MEVKINSSFNSKKTFYSIKISEQGTAIGLSNQAHYIPLEEFF